MDRCKKRFLALFILVIQRTGWHLIFAAGSLMTTVSVVSIF